MGKKAIIIGIGAAVAVATIVSAWCCVRVGCVAERGDQDRARERDRIVAEAVARVQAYRAENPPDPVAPATPISSCRIVAKIP